MIRHGTKVVILSRGETLKNFLRPGSIAEVVSTGSSATASVRVYGLHWQDDCKILQQVDPNDLRVYAESEDIEGADW